MAAIGTHQSSSTYTCGINFKMLPCSQVIGLKTFGENLTSDSEVKIFRSAYGRLKIFGDFLIKFWHSVRFSPSVVASLLSLADVRRCPTVFR